MERHDDLIVIKDKHPYETLLAMMQQVDVSKIRRLRSLDTSQTPVFVYGSNTQQSLINLMDIFKVITKGATLTRDKLLEYRRPYQEGVFFITNDGYYADRQQAITELLQVFELFANQAAVMNARAGKGITAKHNIKLISIIIEDMLVFVGSLRYGDK